MKIIDWSGGLNTRFSPNLIATNESVICNNVDITMGTLTPILGLRSTIRTVPLKHSSFTTFKGTFISEVPGTKFAEYNDTLYIADGINRLRSTKDGINIYEVSLDAPIKAPIVNTMGTKFTLSGYTGKAVPEFTTGTYDYLFVYKIKTSDIIRHKQLTFAYNTLVNTAGILLTLSTLEGIDYVKMYRNYLGTYRYVNQTSSGLTILDNKYDIATSTSVTPSIAELGVRNYVYTYYSSITGFESAPSKASEDIYIEVNKVDISGLLPSSDPTVTNINIYRLGGTLTDFYLVDTISKTSTTYTDNKSDLQVLDGTLLESRGNAKTKIGLKYLTEYNEALFASVGTKLYFSNPGLVDTWPEVNYINFSDVITGLGVVQNGLLVFAKNKTWILIGNDLTTYSKYLLNGNQGCISGDTIAYVDNALLWLSLDGICTSSGGGIDVLSYPKLGKLNITPKCSVVYDSQYFLFHNTGTIIVDFRNGIKFRTLDILARGAHYSTDYDTLYILTTDSIGVKEYGNGTALTYQYKTGYIAENGLTNYKAFKDVYIYSSGSINLKTYIDGLKVNDLDLINGLTNFKIAQEHHRGYYIEFELSGTGTVYEIDIVSEGRQNGR